MDDSYTSDPLNANEKITLNERGRRYILAKKAKRAAIGKKISEGHARNRMKKMLLSMERNANAQKSSSSHEKTIDDLMQEVTRLTNNNKLKDGFIEALKKENEDLKLKCREISIERFKREERVRKEYEEKQTELKKKIHLLREELAIAHASDIEDRRNRARLAMSHRTGLYINSVKRMFTQKKEDQHKELCDSEVKIEPEE